MSLQWLLPPVNNESYFKISFNMFSAGKPTQERLSFLKIEQHDLFYILDTHIPWNSVYLNFIIPSLLSMV